MRVRAVLGAGLAIAALGACTGTGGGDAGGDAGDSAAPIDVGTVRYEQVQEIFTRSCAAFSVCHITARPAGDLDLTVDQAFMETVRVPSTMARGVNIVEPGNPERSFLVHKIQNTMRTLPECMGDNPMQCGVRMPDVEGGELTPVEIATIRAWIAQGAVGPAGGGGGDAGSADASASMDAAGGG